MKVQVSNLSQKRKLLANANNLKNVLAIYNLPNPQIFLPQEVGETDLIITRIINS